MNHETITNTGALSAIVSPFWLPSLEQWSQISALLLPVLGAVWLILQIILKLMETVIAERNRQRAADDRFLATVQQAIDPAKEPHITIVAGEESLTYLPREKKPEDE